MEQAMGSNGKIGWTDELGSTDGIGWDDAGRHRAAITLTAFERSQR